MKLKKALERLPEALDAVWLQEKIFIHAISEDDSKRLQDLVRRLKPSEEILASAAILAVTPVDSESLTLVLETFDDVTRSFVMHERYKNLLDTGSELPGDYAGAAEVIDLCLERNIHLYMSPQEVSSTYVYGGHPEKAYRYVPFVPEYERLRLLLTIASGFKAQGDEAQMEALINEALGYLYYEDESDKVRIFMRIAAITLGLEGLPWGI